MTVEGNRIKISFGIIVLNGEPFTRYCLRQLYPHAHEILVAEGAALSAKEFATKNGHSVDGTLELLRKFKATEDPEDKVRIITSPEGFWADRDAQSSAYAQQATGDVLWQVDIDEFYLPEHIEAARNLFTDKTVTGAGVRWLNFWGWNNVVVDGWFLRSGGGDVNRIFRWGEGYGYGNHWVGPSAIRPDGSIVNHRAEGWVSAAELYRRKGILCYHYSLVFPHQVLTKSKVYKDGTDPTYEHLDSDNWSVRGWLRLETPFFVHNRYDLPSWLEWAPECQPEHGIEMFSDIKRGNIHCEIREMADARSLLASNHYRAIRVVLRWLSAFRIKMGESHWRHYLDRWTVCWLRDGFSSASLRSVRFVFGKLVAKVSRAQRG